MSEERMEKTISSLKDSVSNLYSAISFLRKESVCTNKSLLTL